MRSRRRVLLTVCLALTSCSSTGSPSTLDSLASEIDAQPIFVETTVTSTTDPTATYRSQSREDVHQMVSDFLSQVVPASPALSAAVSDLGELADCMVNAGYQINNIPPENLPNAPTTLVAPSTMIAPMLSYLAEICSGVPVGQWAND